MAVQGGEKHYYGGREQPARHLQYSLDEPSSGLDPEGRLEMRQIIQELKRSGKTILLSSHILSDGLLTLSLNVALTACLTTLLSARLPGAVAAFLGLGVYAAGALRGVLGVGLQMKIMSALERGAGTAFWDALRSIVLWFLPPVNEIAAEAAKFLTPGAVLDAKVYVSALIWLYFGVLLTAVSLYGREV